jgi:GNAT superfamily N-acetyltransferase
MAVQKIEGIHMNLGRNIWCLLLIFCFFSCNAFAVNNSVDIIIRPAILTDIPSAVDLDWCISMEYFKPLYSNYYSHTPIGKDPDYYLKMDCANDKQEFIDCINLVGRERLYVAFDEKTKKVVGLIVFLKKDQNILEIDLLLIDKKYRRRGLGKKLTNAALEEYKECKTCIVYCFSHNKEALAFYESQGFVIIGPGPEDRINNYGISYAELYVCCRREI